MFGFIKADGSAYIGNPIVKDGVVYTESHLRGLSASERSALGIYPVREESYDPSTHRLTFYSYSLSEDGSEIVGTPFLYEIPKEELDAAASAAIKASAVSELAELDKVLPRSTEDLISVLGKWDDPELAFQKARRDRKQELRAIINTAIVQPNAAE